MQSSTPVKNHNQQRGNSNYHKLRILWFDNKQQKGLFKINNDNGRRYEEYRQHLECMVHTNTM